MDIFIDVYLKSLKGVHGAGASCVFRIMACATSFDSRNPGPGELIS